MTIQIGDRVTYLDGDRVYRVINLSRNGKTAFCREITIVPKNSKLFEFKVSDLEAQ